jgi:hypothetical protein
MPHTQKQIGPSRQDFRLPLVSAQQVDSLLNRCGIKVLKVSQR